ncbi:hypothetical protein G6F68_011410 [Rhizopus microsporus]|nr:hypothetical protein G6F68_011410 [Rhizopus microsporus]
MIQTDSATTMNRITRVNTKLARFQPPSDLRSMCRKKTSCTRICATAQPPSRNSVSGRDSTGFITSANGTTVSSAHSTKPIRSEGSDQVDEGEDADPHQVQEVPEHRQAGQAARDDAVQAEAMHLMHQDQDPDQAERHVQAVRADECEVRRQVRAGAGAGAFGQQYRELVELHDDEAGADQEGDAQPSDDLLLAARLHAQHGHAEGEAADQQQHGFAQHEGQMEEFRAGVPARGAVAQHREGGEQHGEDQAVAHQIDPEPHRGLGSVVVVFLVRACGVAKGQMAHGLRGLLKACAPRT